MNDFRAKCEKVSNRYDVAVTFHKEPTGNDAYEDDGTLHVIRDGIRACFDVVNDVASVQNQATRDVLFALKIKVTSRVLAERGSP